jgi:uncharacterized protein YndB with AHSA1/START domain
MPVEISRTIEAPAERVWEVLVRVSDWPRWGPTVTAVRCSDDAIGPGSRGQVRTPVGIWLPFVITDFEPGSIWRWRVGGIPATGHRVHPVTPSLTRLVFEIPRWAVAYGPVCRNAAVRIARICADGPADRR